MSDTLNQFGEESTHDIDLAELAKALPSMTKKDMEAAANEMSIRVSGNVENVRKQLKAYLDQEAGSASEDITHKNGKPSFGAATAGPPSAPMVVHSLSPDDATVQEAIANSFDSFDVPISREGKILDYGKKYWRNPFTNHTVMYNQADTDGRMDVDGYAVHVIPPNPSDAQVHDDE